MNKYIDAKKLNKSVNRYRDNAKAAFNPIEDDADYYKGKIDACKDMQEVIASLQEEQPMPNSTQLIELWHQDKEMLKEKDFRNDPWRLAYNAFLCGFGRGIAVNKQEQPEVAYIFKPNMTIDEMKDSINGKQPEMDLEEELPPMTDDEVLGVCICNQFGNHRMTTKDVREIARHFYKLGLNARKEE